MMKYKLRETKVTTEEIDLLPCPFCGSENLQVFHTNGEYGYSASTDYVACCSCGARGGTVEDYNCNNNSKYAISNWNSRAD